MVARHHAMGMVDYEQGREGVSAESGDWQIFQKGSQARVLHAP